MALLSSYPRPQHALDIPTVVPRPPRPLTTPPASAILNPPQLPCPPRSPDSLKGFIVSTHLVPAAYPRIPYGPAPHVPSSLPGESKGQRIARLQQVGAEQLSRRAAFERGDLSPPAPRNELPWLAANRYVPVGAARDGVTLIFTHGNGMHKETWEPTLRHLLELGAPIAEAWSLDCANQGDSALVNAGVLPEIYDVAESARDPANFLLYYMPDAVMPESLPVHLPRVSEEEVSRRQTSGYRTRTVCAVGHSLGATILFGTQYCPRLFSAVILVEPVFVPLPWIPKFGHEGRVLNTICRRTSWPSRENAFASLRRSPFFQAWDEDVLRAYVEHGMTYSEKDGAQLKTSIYQEMSIFAETRVPNEAWEATRNVPPEVRLFWIMSGTDNTLSGGDAYSAHTVWRRVQNSSNVRLAHAGHLIPQQAPRALAEVLHVFLLTQFGGQLTHRSPLQWPKARL
ncbi:hypothetical protein EXIGLDRAFT_34964 [Exidia glandulosa HHB12029]|uniref:AB hydrolase-1 domain-containing protein n=1 Tax=Exidia glandulosa HHB12029 TaxID=1314781 RepID=A0A165IR64_EXIGL|nr:hypothetical protein EXIGLDRAFT_34964 [Exidia glandulosa HHB12029]